MVERVYVGDLYADGKNLNLLGDFLNAFGQIYIVVNGQILDK